MINDLKYRVADGLLYVNDQVVDLPYPVAEALQIQNILIVRLSIPQKIRFDRNIFALNSYRKTIWQIQASPHGGDVPKPFMDIRQSEDGFLIAANWIGVDYKVDVKNGQIEAIRFSK